MIAAFLDLRKVAGNDAGFPIEILFLKSLNLTSPIPQPLTNSFLHAVDMVQLIPIEISMLGHTAKVITSCSLHVHI